ncbi:translesion DNA synthesis-associated protein ImuA [Chitinibacteraceae bacterium HSL-7]
MPHIPDPTLLKHPALRKGSELASPRTVSSGFAALDAELPGGGWPCASVTALSGRTGAGELTLLWPLLRHDASQATLLLDPPFEPYAPAWRQAGIPLSKLVVVRPERDHDWAFEQILADGACGCALWWPRQPLSPMQERRLQLAAQRGGGCGFVLSPRTNAHSVLPLQLGLIRQNGVLRLTFLKRRGPPLTTPIRLTPNALAGSRPLPLAA